MIIVQNLIALCHTVGRMFGVLQNLGLWYRPLGCRSCTVYPKAWVAIPNLVAFERSVWVCRCCQHFGSAGVPRNLELRRGSRPDTVLSSLHVDNTSNPVAAGQRIVGPRPAFKMVFSRPIFQGNSRSSKVIQINRV